MGAGPLWRKPDLREETLDQLVQSVMTMSRIKMGAIIVLERTMPLGDIVERGVEIDSRLSKELLLTIFHYDTPLHDGAVIVRKGRLAAAACILPLSSKFKGQTVFGTRHRAALGISEESDAVTVVVSEERGAVSVAIGGRLTTSLDEVRLRRVLKTVLER